MHDGFYPLPANANRGTCRSCQAPIAWIVTDSGARMPLDLRTVEQRDGVTMAQTHFATCPHAKGWSKRNNAMPYRGPTGDVNDPEVQAAVRGLAELRKEYGL